MLKDYYFCRNSAKALEVAWPKPKGRTEPSSEACSAARLPRWSTPFPIPGTRRCGTLPIGFSAWRLADRCDVDFNLCFAILSMSYLFMSFSLVPFGCLGDAGSVVKPLLAMIRVWMTEGELQDRSLGAATDV